MTTPIDSDKDRPARSAKRLALKRLIQVLLCLVLACAAILLKPYWDSWQRHLTRHRSNIAFHEIKDIEVAIERIRVDAGVDNLRAMFANSEELNRGDLNEIIQRHTLALYKLLAEGKSAAVDLKPECRTRLASHYYAIGDDWWGREYKCFITEPAGGRIPDLQKKLFSVYTTFSTPEARAIWIRREPEAPPTAIIISTGRDGIFAAMTSKPSRTVNGVILPMGDDITNLTSVGDLTE